MTPCHISLARALAFGLIICIVGFVGYGLLRVSGHHRVQAIAYNSSAFTWDCEKANAHRKQNREKYEEHQKAFVLFRMVGWSCIAMSVVFAAQSTFRIRNANKTAHPTTPRRVVDESSP
jgi:hypothetical protein